MIYLVEFHRGFAAFSSPSETVNIINQEAGIQISTCDSYEHAYVTACKNYSWKEWERNPGTQPVFPRFEDWQSAGFNFNSGLPLMRPYCWRVFSARADDVVAILTSTENIVCFLQQFPYAEIIEHPNVQTAQYSLNWVLLQYLLPFSPYITNGLPFLENLPFDTPIPVNYAEKFKEYLPTIPQQLPHPRPQWKLPAPKGEDDHGE